MRATEISLTALDVEWQRLQVIAQNLANMGSTGASEAGVYRPVRLVSGPGADFSSALQQVTRAPSDLARGVVVLGVEEIADGLLRTHDPAHPHADAQGFVTSPRIDHAAEMALMVRTSRIYEANLAAFGVAQQMYQRALDIGRQS